MSIDREDVRESLAYLVAILAIFFGSVWVIYHFSRPHLSFVGLVCLVGPVYLLDIFVYRVIDMMLRAWLSDRMLDALDKVPKALDERLKQYVSKTIDNGEIIRDTAQQFIDRANKHGRPGVAKAVAQVRDAYTNPELWGNLDRSPHATAAFKTEVYGHIWYGWPNGETSALNDFRRALAENLAKGITCATNDPKIAKLNRRYERLERRLEIRERSFW